MVYAPVLIPTLCRSSHFIRCIESLKKNSWAKYTDVYIALDYPLSEKHFQGYYEICDYLDHGDFSAFSNFYVIKRSENFGSTKNERDIRDYIFSKYEYLIRTDDDVEFAPNFIEYMDKCLEYYENDDSVIMVSGYSYPIKWEVNEDCNCFLEQFSAPMWGAGFWKSKYKKTIRDLKNCYLKKNAIDFLKTKNKKKLMDVSLCEYLFYITSLDETNDIFTNLTDIALRIYLAVKDKYVCYPVITKAINHGFDGSGVYCSKINNEEVNNNKNKMALTYNYDLQKLDGEKNFDIHIDIKFDNLINMHLLNKFDYRNKKIVMYAKIRYFIYFLLGEKNYSKLYFSIKKGNNLTDC